MAHFQASMHCRHAALATLWARNQQCSALNNPCSQCSVHEPPPLFNFTFEHHVFSFEIPLFNLFSAHEQPGPVFSVLFSVHVQVQSEWLAMAMNILYCSVEGEVLCTMASAHTRKH